MMACSKFLQRAVFLPHLLQRILVDSSEFHMGEHGAGNYGTIIPNRNFVGGTAATGKISPVIKLRRSLFTGLFHSGPEVGISQRSCLGCYPAAVFLFDLQQGFHRSLPVLNPQEQICTISSAGAKVASGIGAETREAKFLKQKMGYIFEVMDIMPMDGNPHSDRYIMFPQYIYAPNGLVK
jgi:hypothetical protein